MNNKGFVPLVLILIVVGALVLLGGSYLVIKKAQAPSSQPILGGDKDIHGCIGSAGYSWCEPKQKCLRVWEESCETATSTVTTTSTTISTGGTTSVQTVSVCELQNNPTAYISKKLHMKGIVAFSGNNYYSGNVKFYLEDKNCKIQVSSWAPIEVVQCPPSVSNCSSPSVMSDYVGKSVTLNGQLNKQSYNNGTHYIFQGNLVSN
jgi:hypothetical protein